MDLILWRHAEAIEGEAGEDLARKLTSKGERQAERMAEWLNRRLSHSTRILVSPAVRCQETAKALQAPEMKVVWEGQGATAGGEPPAEFAKLIHAEIAKWAKVVKDAGAKVDN